MDPLLQEMDALLESRDALPNESFTTDTLGVFTPQKPEAIAAMSLVKHVKIRVEKRAPKLSPYKNVELMKKCVRMMSSLVTLMPQSEYTQAAHALSLQMKHLVTNMLNTTE